MLSSCTNVRYLVGNIKVFVYITHNINVLLGNLFKMVLYLNMDVPNDQYIE